MFFFTTDIVSISDVSTLGISPQNRGASRGTDANNSASESSDTPSSTDITTSADEQASTNASSSRTDITSTAYGQASEDASGSIDITTSAYDHASTNTASRIKVSTSADVHAHSGASNSIDAATSADEQANTDVPSSINITTSADAPTSVDASSGIDVTTHAVNQASTNAPSIVDNTPSADAPTSIDASSGIDVSTKNIFPARTSITVKPTTVMSQTKVPTSTTVAVKTTSSTSIARDCSDILDQGYTDNYSIYYIQPLSDSESFEVVCDLEGDGNEWIVIQKRFDGSENFYLPWEDYKNGFGNFTREHWLGLEKLHRLTKNGVWKLRVDLEDIYNNTAYAEYSNFAIGDESTKYTLSIGEYSGTAGDSLSMHANMAFTTYDKDHDVWDYSNCASNRKGAWWYGHCGNSNLNGLYKGLPVIHYTGMYWRDWKTSYEVLKKSEMKIRRIW